MHPFLDLYQTKKNIGENFDDIVFSLVDFLALFDDFSVIFWCCCSSGVTTLAFLGCIFTVDLVDKADFGLAKPDLGLAGNSGGISVASLGLA